MIDSKVVFSVSQLARFLNEHHRNQFSGIRVQGEVASFTKASSGHWYLVLKDDSAQLKAVVFRQRNILAGFSPVLGDKVEVLAQLSIYEPRGELQLIVDVIKKAGQGNLHEQYLQLKAKLSDEGLFDLSRKKVLPSVVFNLGIVTSMQAAALADVRQTLARRAPHVQFTIYHTAVQGEHAAGQIIAALKKADAAGHDALILCRGGGSLEDLWSFNVEGVVRAVFACITPTVLGVGHETDVTLAEFAADLRAATPTAAAELISRPTRELLAQIQGFDATLRRALRHRTQLLVQQVDRAELGLVTPTVYLNTLEARLGYALNRLPEAVSRSLVQQTDRLSAFHQHLNGDMEHMQTFAQQHVNVLTQAINAAHAKYLSNQNLTVQRLACVVDSVSPQRTLERGYAFLKRAQGDLIISSTQQVQFGDVVQATLADGQVTLNVLDKNGANSS